MRVDVARDVDSLHLGPILRIAQDLFGRERPARNDVLVVIDVVQKHVERAHSLLQARFELLPLSSRNDARHDVKRNQALGALRRSLFLLFAIDGERHADPPEHEVGFGTLELHCVGSLLRQPALELAIVRAHTIAAVVHLVERFSLHRPKPCPNGQFSGQRKARAVPELRRARGVGLWRTASGIEGCATLRAGYASSAPAFRATKTPYLTHRLRSAIAARPHNRYEKIECFLRDSER